ncbi:putative SPT4-transcription elongation protein [Tilletiopsis washingtonensis]|uniref:Transcription elongation factor SPT4 n=1 Tax=Tilletiopsis washingtonensis TaxID=58919 RepID=A0A316ZCE5_9BASI|nr:putative SPT4-transcription elongation protein [Tilletiopsis washingtonensis]PWN98986.1 putative SPT4-transcription elongation protein [Tilletiopsis washingtonensis]
MSLTRDAKQLRACLGCLFVQSGNDFLQKGCPNCDQVLQLQQDKVAIQDCTTSQFDGLIAMAQPGQSWVAKWQRIDHRMPGLYAVKVTGSLPAELREQLANER